MCGSCVSFVTSRLASVNAVACFNICEALLDKSSCWSSLPEVLAASFDVETVDVGFDASFFFTSRGFLVFGGSKVTSAGVASSIGLLTALLVLVFFVEASANVVSAATTTSSPATLFDLLRFFTVVSVDILEKSLLAEHYTEKVECF